MRVPAQERRPLLRELTLRGIRITGQRRILLETIQESDRHLDAATLLALARKRDGQIHRATVYRTIELLKKLRLVDGLNRRLPHGGEQLFEAKTHGEHIRLACFRCGGTQEFTSPLFDQLKAEIARLRAFQTRAVRLEIGGYCSKCRAPADCHGGSGAVCCQGGRPA